MPTASPPPDLSDLSAPPADSDRWDAEFEIAAEAGMELGDLLAEHGAIDTETMQRLTELHEELEDAEDIDEEAAITAAAAGIIKAALPAVLQVAMLQNEKSPNGSTDPTDLQIARVSGFATGFMTAVASTVLVGPASSRWERPDGERMN